MAVDLAPLKMNDAGMWVWAGILTAASLVVSFFIAVWWQRWREGKRRADDQP